MEESWALAMAGACDSDRESLQRALLFSTAPSPQSDAPGSGWVCLEKERRRRRGVRRARLITVPPPRKKGARACCGKMEAFQAAPPPSTFAAQCSDDARCRPAPGAVAPGSLRRPHSTSHSQADTMEASFCSAPCRGHTAWHGERALQEMHPKP